MALQVWLPLNGNLNNQGLSSVNIITSGAAINNNGKIGKCYYFDGNSYIKGDNPPITDKVPNWSFACWVKFNSDNDGDCLFSARANTSDRSIAIFGGINNIAFDDGYRWNFYPSISIPINTWVHLCFTREKGVAKKLYVNGILSDSQNIDSYDPLYANSNYFSIAGKLTDSSGSIHPTDDLLNGYLNDIRIYDHCLSAKEVKEISKALIFHYPLTNGGQGGINIAKGTNTENTLNYFYYSEQSGGSTREIVYENGLPCVKVTRTEREHSGWQYVPYTKIQLDMLKPDTWYTVSFDIKTSVNTNINLSSIRKGNATGTISVATNCINSATIADQWSHIVWNVKMMSSFDDVTIDDQLIYLRADYMATPNAWMMMKNMKMEEGLVDTPWSPNPSDDAYNQMGYSNGMEYDTSGLSNNGTDLNVYSGSDTVKYNGSTIFNGTDAYITAPAMTLNMSNITFSFWCKWSEFKSYSRIFDFSQNTSKTERNGFSLVCCNEGTSGTLYINGVNTENEIFFPVTKSNIALNTWYHVVITISDTTGKVYKNNELIATVQTLAVGNVPSNYNYIGKSNYPNDSLFEGNISDFRIYATTLSAEDVKELYEQSAFIDNKGNIGCYEFVES